MRKFALLVILVLSAGILHACGGDIQHDAYGPATQDDMQSIIRFGRDWPTFIDPAVGSSYTCQISHVNLYSPLVFPNTDGTVRPHIATDWSVSDDGLTYIFSIRDDVLFHSGNPLRASDVAYSMNRMLAIGQGFSHLYVGIVQDARALDDTTVEMTLYNTFGPFVNSLTRLFIVEEALVRANYDMDTTVTFGDHGDYGMAWMLTNAAGSGPYMIHEIMLDEFVLGIQFPDYFLGWEENAPMFFRLSNMNDPVAQRTAFANRTLEISSDNMPQETLTELENMGGILVERASAGGWNMFLNTQIAPTDCVYFRKALSYAFDYDTVMNVILPGSQRATGPVASNLFGKNHDLPGYHYDLDLAREYLSKSKYADDPSIWSIDLAWVAEITAQEQIALMFQASLQQLGIDLNIIRTPFSVMTSNSQTIETTPHASMVLWSPSFFEAGDVFRSRYHSASTGSWEQMEWLLDSELDRMIDNSLTILDDAERAAAYEEIEAYIFDLAPTIWIARADARYVMQPFVKWYVHDFMVAGERAILPTGFDMYYRDFRVNVDARD